MVGLITVPEIFNAAEAFKKDSLVLLWGGRVIYKDHNCTTCNMAEG